MNTLCNDGLCSLTTCSEFDRYPLAIKRIKMQTGDKFEPAAVSRPQQLSCLPSMRVLELRDE